MFSKTTKAEFTEWGPRLAGGSSTKARNEGLVLRYRMCYYALKYTQRLRLLLVLKVKHQNMHHDIYFFCFTGVPHVCSETHKHTHAQTHTHTHKSPFLLFSYHHYIDHAFFLNLDLMHEQGWSALRTLHTEHAEPDISNLYTTKVSGSKHSDGPSRHHSAHFTDPADSCRQLVYICVKYICCIRYEPYTYPASYHKDWLALTKKKHSMYRIECSAALTKKERKR